MKGSRNEWNQEPACEHSKPEKKGCARPKPGEAAGGCAFDGAQITLLPIADAAHLIHGPIGCLGNSWESRGSLSSGPDLSRFGFTTDLSEQDIVMGGEQKLKGAISDIAVRYHPPAIFVYSTCVTALTGEDMDRACQEAEKEYHIPVIPVHSPGFAGSKNWGNRLAGEALFDHVISKGNGTPLDPEEISQPLVNLIGEYNIAGEQWDIEELLNKAGIHILSRITGDGRFRDIGKARHANANMVVCSRALVTLARRMEETYQIPYFEGSFYGARETGFSLRQLAFLIGDNEIDRKVSRLIRSEEEALTHDLLPLRKKLRGKKAVLYTGGVKSWSMITALQELGIQVVGVGTNKSTDEDISRIKERVGMDADLIPEGGAARILKTVRERKADLMIAGGRNLYVSMKEQIPFLDINQERHKAYAGYVGMRRLAADLVAALEHPVWNLVRRPAPWEGARANGTDR
ncbi:nitrogenase iron-molybdenum cofactor biosynthesis protein NifE [Gorillibacterium timonense]|uniref:nitrogenase iron-molybdenum cofactor biosynthesis protein NifE n=1 Tax=Gorillibacterium timonense TaxID=1689269 RepID=UPI00071CD992|nr:nitrogenase iron-molybdenum cofactor biosynthesis protein NifE [Gorillibacterium timonense]